MRIYPFTMAAICLLTTVVAGATTQDAEEEALRNLMDEFVAAYNRHDAAAIAELFAPDADACVSLSKYQGRDQIERFFADLEGDAIESPSKASPVRFLTPNVALMDVETTLSGLRGANGGELPPIMIKACFIATKQNDRWVYGALRIQTFSTSSSR